MIIKAVKINAKHFLQCNNNMAFRLEALLEKLCQHRCKSFFTKQVRACQEGVIYMFPQWEIPLCLTNGEEWIKEALTVAIPLNIKTE